MSDCCIVASIAHAVILQSNVILLALQFLVFGPRHSLLEDFFVSGIRFSGPLGSSVLCRGRFPGGL